MTIRAGAKLDATDFDIPDPVNMHGNGTNTITATSFANLPTTACSGSIVNPHPTASLLCIVHFGAWISIPASSATAVRICPAVSGSTTIAAGLGTEIAGWGAIPRAAVVGQYDQFAGFGTYQLPPGTATFTMQAYKESAAAGTHQVNYATIQVTPVRYVF